MARCWAVIAGGGTAGHSVPALAVAEALVERGHDRDTIHLVGSRRGAEGASFAAAGFPYTLLPGRGINERKLTAANLLAAGGLVAAAAGAVGLVARLRPAVVLSTGGFAAMAPGAAAVLLRVPLVLHAQNAIPTAGNLALARFARASAVTFEGTPMPRAVVTGNPVRAEILAADPGPDGKRRAREALGLPTDRVVIFAFGSSLGTRRINVAVSGLARRWADRDDLAIRHVWGRRDWADAAAAAPPGGALLYQAVEYEDRMAEALVAADVIVSRAGGGTVSELAVVGRPAVLVPLPIAAEDHQTANARVLESAGGGILVRDDELDTDRLEAELTRLLADRDRLEAMGRAAATVGRRNAASLVAQLLEQHAR